MTFVEGEDDRSCFLYGVADLTSLIHVLANYLSIDSKAVIKGLTVVYTNSGWIWSQPHNKKSS